MSTKYQSEIIQPFFFTEKPGRIYFHITVPRSFIVYIFTNFQVVYWVGHFDLRTFLHLSHIIIQEGEGVQ